MNADHHISNLKSQISNSIFRPSDLDIRLREWLHQNWNDRIMDLVGDGVYVINLDATILRYNRAFKEIWTSLHIETDRASIGNITSIFASRMLREDLVAVRLSHQKLINGSRSEKTMRRFLTKGGTTRCFDVTETPVRNGDRMWGIIGIIRERTDEEIQDHSRSFLDSSERERVEHSLRSSLGLIRGYAFALDRYSGLDRKQQERFIGYIREEADRLSRWLDDVFDTPEHQQEVLSMLEMVSLADILRTTAQHIGEYANRRGIAMTQDIPNTLPEILASREVLTRIMDHVLDKAVSLSPPDGKITVAANDRDKEISVEVTDLESGGKVDDSFLSVVEERYSDQYDMMENDGAGIGLATAKRLTESMGGKIGITTVPGKGTTFKLTFPKQINPSRHDLASRVRNGW
jgi:signal transduction histidine kinase